MVKIEKYFPHKNMREFMDSINEITLDGVYTCRITPGKMETPEKYTHEYCMNFLNKIKEIDNYKKILAFKEHGTKCGRHYHIRFVTHNITRQQIVHLITKSFSWPKGKGRSNEAYSLRSCKEKDKSVWASATYIAKEGDCCFRYGYTQEQVNYFTYFGQKIATFKNIPKFEQIIIIYGLDKISQLDLRGKDIYDAVIDFHNKKKIEIPAQHRIHNLIHNICFKLSDNYRLALKERVCEGIDRKLGGNFPNF